MEKITSVLLVLSCIFTITSLGYVANAQVAIGSRSEEVKMIQEILKTDPNIYPDGYVTGYYGQLTTNAVKKLQKRCRLPETGVIDTDTEKCIYPTGYKIRVISPNGGEVWNRNETHTIQWEVIEPEVSIPERPLWSKASIDLFRRIAIPTACMVCPSGQVCPPCPTSESIFVRHIATVNLFDKAWTYGPRTTSDVPNGSDYVIRISTGEGIVSIWTQEIKTAPGTSIPVRTQDIWPVSPPLTNQVAWDESDGTFTITGEISPICPVCPVICPERPNLEKVITILQNMIAELQKAIALLK
jgi:peptidoglycan hydrolase-like protein with peptidoglycan-binding domain